jgi:hypothetical protein
MDIVIISLLLINIAATALLLWQDRSKAKAPLPMAQSTQESSAAWFDA